MLGPADRDTVRAVTIAAYQEYAAAMPAHWEGYRQNIIATLGAAAPGTQIVALDDDRVVGAVLLYPAGASIEKPGRHHHDAHGGRRCACSPSRRPRGGAASAPPSCTSACTGRERAAATAVDAAHHRSSCRSAMRLYERLGFARAPDLDLEPAPGIVAKGYRLDLPL